MFPQLPVCLPRVFRHVIPPDLAAYGEGWIVCVSQTGPENARSRALKASFASLRRGFLFWSCSPAFCFFVFIFNHSPPFHASLSMFSPKTQWSPSSQLRCLLPPLQPFWLRSTNFQPRQLWDMAEQTSLLEGGTVQGCFLHHRQLLLP